MSEREEKARAELVAKLRALSKARGFATSGELFRAFDDDKDGELQAHELKALLAAASVGNGLTRGKWVSKIFERLDANGSSGLELDELNGVLRELDPPPPPATGTTRDPATGRTVPFEVKPAERAPRDLEDGSGAAVWLILGALVFWLKGV